MSETIEAPKVKRTYTRKPKSVTPLTTGVLGGPPNDPIPTAQSPVSDSSTSTELSLTPPEQVPQKPKRTYKKKVAIAEPVVENIPEPQTNRIRETTELIDTPPSSPVPETTSVKEKRPRTEKQIAAFNRMREARLKKQEELTKLRDLERQEKKIDSEKKKLDAVTEKIVEKATEIKKKRQSRKKVEVPNSPPMEPQMVPIINTETKYRNIVFA
jgi:hypothetical protein